MALGGSSGGQAGGVRAGRAYVELGAKDSLTAHLKKVAGRFAEFGKKVLAVTGAGGLVGGFVGGLSFKETTDDLREMNDAIKAMGMSAAGGSGLFGVLNQFSDIGENVEGLTQFAQKVQDAFDGIGDEPKKLFEGLSVSAADLISLPLEEKFYRIHAAIRELPQAQQQFKLSMLGGTDSMKKWLPLLSMSNDELRAQAEHLAFNSAELENATRANRAITQAGAAANRVWQEMAIALAPVVAELSNMVAGGLKPMAAWMQGRTLQDLWDGLVARGNQAWVEIKIGFGETLSDIFDYFTSGWNSAVLVVKTMFADMGEALANAVREPLRGAIEVLAKINPAAAAAISGALAGSGAAANAIRIQAAKDFDAAERDIRQKQADRGVTKDRLRAEAQAAVDAIEKRVQAARDSQGWRDWWNGGGGGRMAGRAAGLSRSMATFGAGSFLSQSLGTLNASDPAKQMVKEQKKGNDLLAELVDKAKPLVFA